MPPIVSTYYVLILKLHIILNPWYSSYQAGVWKIYVFPRLTVNPQNKILHWKMVPCFILQGSIYKYWKFKYIAYIYNTTYLPNQFDTSFCFDHRNRVWSYSACRKRCKNVIDARFNWMRYSLSQIYVV